MRLVVSSAVGTACAGGTAGTGGTACGGTGAMRTCASVMRACAGAMRIGAGAAGAAGERACEAAYYVLQYAGRAEEGAIDATKDEGEQQQYY